MPIDWERQHPLDTSCVEADMVAKTFGWASDLHHDGELKLWKALLTEAGLTVPEARWANVKVKFSAFPPHHGCERRGEIGDVVLLGPELFVVVEAKRPHAPRDPHLGSKRRDIPSSYPEWQPPDFILVGSEKHREDGWRLLTWDRVADVLRRLLGKDNAISRFIEEQIGLTDRRPPRQVDKPDSAPDKHEKLTAIIRGRGLETFFAEVVDVLKRAGFTWKAITRGTVPFYKCGDTRAAFSIYPRSSSKDHGLAMCVLFGNLGKSDVFEDAVRRRLPGARIASGTRPSSLIVWLRGLGDLRAILEVLDLCWTASSGFCRTSPGGFGTNLAWPLATMT